MIKLLSDLQISTLECEGYLIIDNLFSSDDLWVSKEEFNMLVEHQSQALYQAGRLSDWYQDLPFERRLTEIAIQELPNIRGNQSKVGNRFISLRPAVASSRRHNGSISDDESKTGVSLDSIPKFLPPAPRY